MKTRRPAWVVVVVVAAVMVSLLWRRLSPPPAPGSGRPEVVATDGFSTPRYVMTPEHEASANDWGPTEAAGGAAPAILTAPIPEGEPPPDYQDVLGDPDLSDEEVITVLALAVRHPQLPIADRMDALTHLHHLVVLGQETRFLRPLLNDPALPSVVTEEIMDESLNRDFAWQAELMLTVLGQRTEESLRDTARRHLAFLTDADHGDDLARWREAVAEAARTW